jgi:hypothetical protein
MYATEIAPSGIHVSTDLAAEECYVNCDVDRLQQVFWIIKNAAVFTPKEGLIHIRTFNIASSIGIAFRDTGIGMSPETIQNLFKPFDGKAPANSRGQKGSAWGFRFPRRSLFSKVAKLPRRVKELDRVRSSWSGCLRQKFSRPSSAFNGSHGSAGGTNSPIADPPG